MAKAFDSFFARKTTIRKLTIYRQLPITNDILTAGNVVFKGEVKSYVKEIVTRISDHDLGHWKNVNTQVTAPIFLIFNTFAARLLKLLEIGQCGCE